MCMCTRHEQRRSMRAVRAARCEGEAPAVVLLSAHRIGRVHLASVCHAPPFVCSVRGCSQLVASTVYDKALSVVLYLVVVRE